MNRFVIIINRDEKKTKVLFNLSTLTSILDAFFLFTGEFLRVTFNVFLCQSIFIKMKEIKEIPAEGTQQKLNNENLSTVSLLLLCCLFIFLLKVIFNLYSLHKFQVFLFCYQKQEKL